LPSSAAREATARASQKPGDLPTVTAVFPRSFSGVAEATVGGKRVKEGDVVEGWRVVKILGAVRGEQPGVRLALGDREVEVPLEAAVSKRPSEGAGASTRTGAEQGTDH
jgi:hypothetical protein